MTFNLKSIVFFFAVATMIGLSSCSEDEDIIAAPEIIEIEIGIGNSLLAYVGSDLHMDAEIVAEGTIDKILVEIHKEDGTGEEIEAEYTEYSGLKNTTFHKHIEIPEDAETGEYHFHLTVIDQEGNSTSTEADIMIEELEDTEAPVIMVSSAPSEGQEFATGETISISGTITDNITLTGMLVALVYEDDNLSDEDVKGSNDKVIVMMHTHDLENHHEEEGDDHDHDHEDYFETEFEATINVGATMDNNMTPAAIEGNNAWKSGNYFILVKSSDAKQNGAVSERYPIKINM